MCDFIFCCLLLWLKSVLFCFLLRFTQSIPVYRFHFQRLSFILEFSIFRNIFLFALLVMHAYKETRSCWRPRVSLFFIYLFIYRIWSSINFSCLNLRIIDIFEKGLFRQKQLQKVFQKIDFDVNFYIYRFYFLIWNIMPMFSWK